MALPEPWRTLLDDPPVLVAATGVVIPVDQRYQPLADTLALRIFRQLREEQRNLASMLFVDRQKWDPLLREGVSLVAVRES